MRLRVISADGCSDCGTNGPPGNDRWLYPHNGKRYCPNCVAYLGAEVEANAAWYGRSKLPEDFAVMPRDEFFALYTSASPDIQRGILSALDYYVTVSAQWDDDGEEAVPAADRPVMALKVRELLHDLIDYRDKDTSLRN